MESAVFPADSLGSSICQPAGLPAPGQGKVRRPPTAAWIVRHRDIRAADRVQYGLRNNGQANAGTLPETP